MENTAQNTPERRIEVSPAIRCFSLENTESQELWIEKSTAPYPLAFFFGIAGGSSLWFDEKRRRRRLEPNRSLLYYDPVGAPSLHLQLDAGARLFALQTGIDELHRLLGADKLYSPGSGNAEKPYEREREISPGITIVLSQLAHCELSAHLRPLYHKAKAYELLCLYFETERQKAEESCPFLLDEEHLCKIRKAKRILIENMADPPALKALSQKVGLNEYRLKLGFKNIYGNTLYGFLMDYKMEYARKLIQEEKLQIKAIAYNLGYENPSHFIAAFKRKYGVTPKKYASAQ